MLKWIHRGLASVVMLGAALVLVFGGCKKDEKVDCKVFCDREAECFNEIAVRIGAASKAQLALLGKDKLKEQADKQRDRCTTSCTSPTKPKGVDEQWIGCLKKTDCTAFAACVYPPNAGR